MFDFMSLCTQTAERNFSGDWTMIWSTVVTGIVVVFLILVILVIILLIMGKIMTAGEKKAKKKAEAEKAAAQAAPAQAASAQTAPAAVQSEPEEEYDENDEEIIAVISAAIAAYSEADGRQYKVVGIKKREKAVRSGWSAAGISDNTRPF